MCEVLLFGPLRLLIITCMWSKDYVCESWLYLGLPSHNLPASDKNLKNPGHLGEIELFPGCIHPF